jgi:rhodanese-related sulfurtransferase
MAVDVQTEIVIARPREDVAAFACDPDNATAWYRNIKAVAWETSPPLAVGTRVRFVAQFLGRRLEYTYEVREHVPGERFVMSTSQGPFPMETTYTWRDAGAAATRMTLRNRGEPAGFAKVTGSFMGPAIRRANSKDLARLKAILEARPSGRVTVDQLLATARAGLDRMTPDQALAAQRSGAVVVDIRSDAHRARDGEIPGARHHARNVLEWRLDPACEHRDPESARRDVRVILVCDEGFQSSLAAATVRRFGVDATDIVGGFQAWRTAGLPVDHRPARG